MRGDMGIQGDIGAIWGYIRIMEKKGKLRFRV